MTTIVFSKTNQGLWTYASDRKATTGPRVNDFMFIKSKILRVSDLIVGFSGSLLTREVACNIKTHPLAKCHNKPEHFVNCISTGIRSSYLGLFPDANNIAYIGDLLVIHESGSDVYTYRNTGAVVNRHGSFASIGSGSKFAYTMWDKSPNLSANHYVKYATARDRYSSGLASY